MSKAKKPNITQDELLCIAHDMIQSLLNYRSRWDITPKCFHSLAGVASYGMAKWLRMYDEVKRNPDE